MKKKILPHLAIIISGMMIVFFVIDKVNPAMGFINNNITKALLLILSILSIANAAGLLGNQRKLELRRQQQLAAKRKAAQAARTKRS